MKRRTILNFIRVSHFALISSHYANENQWVNDLNNRRKKSIEYTLAAFEPCQ
ncbi:hypothetical protein OKW21_003773 [Catalinimonas alkaloidigena]|nr:hypothetical protein [Catalinimonas alkaloidigena]